VVLINVAQSCVAPVVRKLVGRQHVESLTAERRHVLQLLAQLVESRLARQRRVLRPVV
jgi:hypothetical protein